MEAFVEDQLEGMRDACSRASPTCLSTAQFSKQLQETRESTGTCQPLGFLRGTVRVWSQGEMGPVLARLRPT